MRQILTIAVVVVCMAVAVLPAPTPKLPTLVRQVDHIVVESDDAKALFDFFTDPLQLPVVWPISESQGRVTAGVGVGNLTIELLGNSKGNERKNAQARYSGLALQPLPLERILRELQVRGVRYNAPEPTTSILPDGSRGVAWTTVALPMFSRPGMSIFLYEYSPKFLKTDVRRIQMGNRLMLNKGGPLGVQSAAEIVISTANMKKDRELWNLLLGTPAEPADWKLDPGPSIRLVQGEQDRISEITLRIQSLDRAEAFLKKKNLIGSSSADWIALRPSALQGLRILLQAKR